MRTGNRFFRGFKKGVKGFGQNVSIIVNSVLLFIVYLLGIGLPAVVGRLKGMRFLETELSKKNTYWSDLNLKKKRIGEYYRQF
ncbi:hypothetical protein KY362_08355 [Candidatus Woesearchaeota archaeon]|nr:hypothetical protein [Candidatus Woesearchaeota archaeon]